ncbi:GTP-binding protein 2-like isoform X2 [Tigriopus californicus]|uniref:GTP-binding protein 2-like isoform X2 n=1 Tax=Tigriopus californicus TaxID=6832 RepID=UPI0027DA59B4|nr:GTP-binding protein 2-like isoform X2 [Tigriopus californicus]
MGLDLVVGRISGVPVTIPSLTAPAMMSGFSGFDLFDPGTSDEPASWDDLGCLSASAFLAQSKPVSRRVLPPRSKTAIDLTHLKTQPIGTFRIRTRMHSSHSEGDFTSLPPEPQQGNIEYKLKLVNPTEQRLEHLVTQMKWRLREGQGEAIYEIGVEDNGLMTGLSEEDLTSSLDTLREMARRLGATINVLREKVTTTEHGLRTVAEVLVRKVPDDQQCIDLRVCVLGNADVGKSTLVGVLTQGHLDNGRGRARLNMFRHLHEIQSGRTSSISHELLGFDADGQAIDYVQCNTAEEICEHSSKLITFIDLAGHQKYLRTTISGLTGYCPHYVMLVISASAGVVPMTQDLLSMAVALEVPFFVMVTKVDMTPKPKLQATLASLQSLLTSVGANKVPLVVKTADHCITAAGNALKENVVPIFCVSAVTGTGLTLAKKFLHLLPPGAGLKEQEKLEQDHPEFQIDEIFDVPHVGTVVGGLVTQGIITEGMTMNLGPFPDGHFQSVSVSSIKRNRAGCRLVRATQSAALAIDFPFSDLRRGMSLVDPRATETHACLYFQAKISVLFHPKAISPGFQTSVHIGNVRQTAVMEAIIAAKGLQNNDQASVIFRFIRHPEYIKVGQRLLFRDGRSKGIGKITQIFPYEKPVTGS